MFGQTALQQIERLPESDETARPWRVVSADGSTRVFEAAVTVDDDCRRAVSGLELMASLTSPPPGRSIAMPSAVPVLSKLLETDEETSPCDLFEWQRAIPPPNLGAVVVVDRGGDRRPGGPLSGKPSEFPRQQDLPSLPIPHQETRRGCRDVDSQLARVIEIWPNLSGSARAAVLAMVEAAKDTP